MAKATITYNNRNSAVDTDEKEAIIYGQPIDTLTLDRARYNGTLEVNGEEFIVLPATGQKNVFNRPHKIEVFKKGEEGQNTIGESIEHAMVSGIMDAILPVHGILEYVKMATEGFQHLDKGAGRKLDVTPEPININPKAAINPNLGFLPRSPFIIQNKPTPLLWNRVNQKNIEEEKKRKKRSYGSY
jgi:hypothetical protein